MLSFPRGCEVVLLQPLGWRGAVQPGHVPTMCEALLPRGFWRVRGPLWCLILVFSCAFQSNLNAKLHFRTLPHSPGHVPATDPPCLEIGFKSASSNSRSGKINSKSPAISPVTLYLCKCIYPEVSTHLLPKSVLRCALKRS